MSLIVQKFGGTSVADIDRIKHVASHVAREVNAGHKVMVTVSAMAGVTNQLVAWAQEMSPLKSEEARADHDHVVSSGEMVTSGLLALHLREQGIPARAMAGWQLPIHTDGNPMSARITKIDTDTVSGILNNGEVIVIAGFQGIGPDGRITTLGRGGSDTTAVALAAAFNAERCDIYTDVDGIYSCDPRIVPRARKMQQISYEEMLELASLGAKVLQTRSVEMAMNHGVKLRVRSTFDTDEGTLLVMEEDMMEEHKVTGIAYSRDEARISLTQVENKPGVSAAIFGPLADRGINVDMIVQNVTEDGATTDVTFTVPKAELERAAESVKEAKRTPPYATLHTDRDVVKVSVVGVGMRSHTGVAAEMFRALSEKGINIIIITTSEIKISVLIEEEYLELALRALHTSFGLDAEEEAS